jgi:2'-5' RNA ligase
METSSVYIGAVIDSKTTKAMIDETLQLDTSVWDVTPQEQFHVTILFIGDVSDSIIPDIKIIIANIASRVHPFMLTGGRTRIMQPDEPTMLWIRYERNLWLEKLSAELETCFKRIGTWEKYRDRKHRKASGGERFSSPHITIGRIKGGGMLESLLPPFEPGKNMQTAMIRKIALFSRQRDKKTGLTHHEKLEEWELED